MLILVVVLIVVVAAVLDELLVDAAVVLGVVMEGDVFVVGLTLVVVTGKLSSPVKTCLDCMITPYSTGHN